MFLKATHVLATEDRVQQGAFVLDNDSRTWYVSLAHGRHEGETQRQGCAGGCAYLESEKGFVGALSTCPALPKQPAGRSI